MKPPSPCDRSKCPQCGVCGKCALIAGFEEGPDPRSGNGDPDFYCITPKDFVRSNVRRFCVHIAILLCSFLYAGSASAMTIIDCWHPAAYAGVASSTLKTLAHSPAHTGSIFQRRHIPLVKSIELPHAICSDAEPHLLPAGDVMSIPDAGPDLRPAMVTDTTAPRPPPLH